MSVPVTNEALELITQIQVNLISHFSHKLIWMDYADILGLNGDETQTIGKILAVSNDICEILNIEKIDYPVSVYAENVIELRKWLILLINIRKLLRSLRPF